MIEFRRDGSTVSLFVESNLEHKDGGKTHFSFKFECANDYSAQLLQIHLREKFELAVMGAQQAAYRDGWKDAKAKKGGKREWFSRVLKVKP